MARVLDIEIPDIQYLDENSDAPVGTVEFSHSKLFHPAIIAASENPMEEPVTRELKPQEMMQWNKFLDFVKAKGYEGSEQLNKRNKNLGQALFDEFKKSNPEITINYDIVPSVQLEMQKLQKSAQEFAKRRGDKNAESLMQGISPVDAWFGSKTSQFRFPEMRLKEYRNTDLVANKNLGLVNSSLRPVAMITKQQVPKGIKLEQFFDSTGNKTGLGYQDPDTGDLIIVNE